MIANSLTAGIVMWGYSPVSNPNDPNCYVDLTIEGFLDIYNWKDTNTTQLVPNTETGAGFANGLIEKNLNKPEFDSYFYKEDSMKYIHAGMFIISTGNLSDNKAVVNGLDAVKFEKRTFPLPREAKLILKTCYVVGYGTGKKPPIKPTETMGDNPNLFTDLRNGRK